MLMLQLIVILTIANDVLGKGNVDLVFGAKNLHILRNIGAKVAYGPGSQYCVLVGGRAVIVISGGQNETGLSGLHPGPNQIAAFQC